MKKWLVYALIAHFTPYEKRRPGYNIRPKEKFIFERRKFLGWQRVYSASMAHVPVGSTTVTRAKVHENIFLLGKCVRFDCVVKIGVTRPIPKRDTRLTLQIFIGRRLLGRIAMSGEILFQVRQTSNGYLYQVLLYKDIMWKSRDIQNVEI